ncbi:MAG: bifunctional glutamate N-acetyltransferase/amino-acid acetyltransferase ArgJ [Vicinamibacterales bacterium]
MSDSVEFIVVPADGGVTCPEGFTSSALHAGIKKSGALDMMLLACDASVPAAGLFTTNLARAAPVLVSREHLERTSGHARAIVTNSGCANACTGTDGFEHARLMTSEAAAALACRPEDVLVASTGVIGVKLDITKVLPGIRTAAAALARGHGADAARAIMTTDPFPKSCAVTVTTPAGAFRVGGTAKGSGMIEPDMATMLGYLTTDADVPPAMLDRALRASARDTFNAITVDGECSTNDSLFAMASGASGVRIDDALYPALLAGLRHVSRDLALGIVRGGEGATKLVAVTATGAASDDDARRVARTIANSLLVKTAIHGADPNWGRIVASAGRSGVRFDLGSVTVRVGDVVLFEDGLPHDERAEEAEALLRQESIAIAIDIGTGGAGTATIWTCDLSAEYVRINGEYRT